MVSPLSWRSLRKNVQKRAWIESVSKLIQTSIFQPLFSNSSNFPILILPETIDWRMRSIQWMSSFPILRLANLESAIRLWMTSPRQKNPWPRGKSFLKELQSRKIFPDTLAVFDFTCCAEILWNHMPILRQSYATFELATAAQTFRLKLFCILQVCLQLWIFS